MVGKSRTCRGKKEAALHELWIETEGRPSKNMRESLKAVYRKAGVTASQKTTLLPEVHALCSSRNTLGSVRICHLLSDQSRIPEIAMVKKITLFAGEMLYIDLPDGKVQTNSGTLLLYPEKFIGNTRTVFPTRRS